MTQREIEISRKRYQINQLTRNLIFEQTNVISLARLSNPSKLPVEKLIALLINTNEGYAITSGIRAKRIKFEKTGLEDERDTEPSASKLNNDPSLDDLTR